MKPIAFTRAWLLAAFCAIAASSACALEQEGTEDGANAAVSALLAAADESLNAGRPEDAAILVERALRIEPRDPAAWHYLGRARLGQRNFAQAEAMAAKSHSLAVGDRSLRARNAELMAAAQQAAGKPVSVPSIEPPVPAWQRLLAAAVEPARTYAADGEAPERPDERYQTNPTSADAAALTVRAARSADWRRSDGGYAERSQRERPARRNEGKSRSMIVLDGRQFRRQRSNDVVRRLQL